AGALRPPRARPAAGVALAERARWALARARAGAGDAGRAARARLRALWARRAVRRLAVPAAAALVVLAATVHHVYVDATRVPDIEPFIRFEPPTIGSVYDARGQVLIELAREDRRIVHYEEVPPWCARPSWPRRTRTSSRIPASTTAPSRAWPGRR